MDEIKETALKAGIPEDKIDYKGLKEHKKISKMSSAGLIYKQFGKEIIKRISKEVYKQELAQVDVDRIFFKIYNTTMLEIDAHDNGVNVAKETVYDIGSNISQRVSLYNSPWNAPQTAGYSQHS